MSPKGWQRIPFTDVFDISGGTQPPKSKFIYEPREDYIRLLQIRDFGEAPVPTYIPDSVSLKKCRKDDVLIARYGASLGRILTGQEGAYNVAMAKVLIPETFDRRFVMYLLRSDFFQEPLRRFSRSAQNGFNKRDLSSIILPIAPAEEQGRIADKLEALFGRVAACRERLDRLPWMLKRFREAVLEAAVSGKLTEEWRGKTDRKDTWKQFTVEHIAEVGTGSTPLRSNPHFYCTSGTPWVTSAATSSEFIKSSPEFVTNTAISAHRLRKYPAGTLLIAMYGEGKTRGQVSELLVEATINQACAAIIVNESLAHRGYVKVVLRAGYLRMRELAEGGNQPNLNLSKIKAFPIPLPLLTEQIEIVRRVAEMLALADSLERQYLAASNSVGKITPSVLAKAFRGELVPQDSTDEPASVLLEWIRKGREADPAGKGRGKRAAAEKTDTKERGRRLTVAAWSGRVSARRARSGK